MLNRFEIATTEQIKRKFFLTSLGLSDGLLKYAMNLVFSFGNQLKCPSNTMEVRFNHVSGSAAFANVYFSGLWKAMIFNFGHS